MPSIKIRPQVTVAQIFSLHRREFVDRGRDYEGTHRARETAK